ncbi:MAG: prolyl oligopeptidase family serine peptidase [Propionibacteriales bacterium]|nr:prolyl oligopeptidase family serine peptidase [Propionibacteriales bacterium]
MTDAPVATSARLAPPVAKEVPQERVHHGDMFVDPYEWLRDKDDAETVAYLEAENTFTKQQTGHLEQLQEQIFTEIKTRTQETDLSVPTRVGDWWYYSRTVEGQQYSLHCRTAAGAGDWTPPTLEAGVDVPGEEVLLDGNALADGKEFFSLGAFSASIDGTLLAFSTDFVGDERYTLQVKDLRTGQLLPDVVEGTLGGATWDLTGSTLFYTTVDDAWRPHKVWRHALGTPATDDVVVFEETDERYWLSAGRTRSDRFVFLVSGSKTTTEYRVLDADDPTGEPRVVAPRRQGVEYHLEHAVIQGEDRFLVLHNENALDFELAEAPVDDAAPERWTPVISHSPGTRLEDVEAFRTHLVVSQRRNGRTEVRVLPLSDDGYGESYPIEFDEPIYTVGTGGNPDFEQPTIRLGYTSMVTPASVYDFDVRTRERTLRKQTPVLGGYDPNDYEQYREWATAPDGTEVPISIVCRKGTPRDGRNPALIYGYGSYEMSMDPAFGIPRLSLLDRGVVVAIAHVRGGGEMGRRWYDEGKVLQKKNTFTDFVACAQHLTESGWTAPDHLVAHGGSAGGLLMGAVANLAPEAFTGILAEVPFVDALTSILDPSLPLTVIEWEEWGDPLHDPDVYAYMKSYSPYENVEAKDYPAVLAITSLNDTRVLYVEPAKWVARLRATATGDAPVLLKTEMEAGHGGRSGRYDAWRERAFSYAWVVDTAGAAHETSPKGS